MAGNRFNQFGARPLGGLAGAAFSQNAGGVYRPADLRERVAGLPAKDRAELREFFLRLIRDQQFGYGLLGVKPVSFCALTLNPEPQAAPPNQYDRRTAGISAWQVWQRHSDYFVSSRRCLRLSEDKTAPNRQALLLIDVQAVRDAVAGEIDLFRARLGSQTSPDEIMFRLLQAPGLWAAVGNHEALAGILLGFGRGNALMYERREALRDHQADGRWICRKDAVPSEGFKQAQTELDRLEQTLQNTSLLPGQTSRTVPPVGFLADITSAETAALVQKYSAARERIETLLKSSQFLTDVLQQFVYGK